ncbi:MotA/TolQ/ExbB proton channel family protein [Methylibium sp.]|uniref:MotA/TolQ/ExbB proton channel family protein n=1 Tax=Methylibium sp. TaxID=2067992 RepID=UPI003D0B0898
MVRSFALRSATALLAAFAFIVLVGGTALAPSVAQAQAAASGAAPSAGVLPPVAAPPASTQVVDNPYGLESLWKTSDGIAKTVLLILLIMSMGSWYIIVVKLVEQAKINRQAKLAAKTFWSAGSVRQGADTLEAASPFRFIAEAGLEATKKHSGLFEHVDLNSWVTMSIQRAMDRVQSRLQDGLAFLATVGSTAPFVGLFGTVWGIYHALTAIGVAGQASIDKVAGPVGEALIMTAIGLAVAVPAVLGYNWLVRRNKGSMEEVRAFGNDLHSVLLATSQTPARA